MTFAIRQELYISVTVHDNMPGQNESGYLRSTAIRKCGAYAHAENLMAHRQWGLRFTIHTHLTFVRKSTGSADHGAAALPP